MRLSLDANVLVYAAQKNDRRHAVAASILRRAVEAECIQTLQSFGECFNVLRRKRGFALPEARQIINEYQVLFRRVIAADFSDLDRAMRVCVEHGIQYWDALLWATARRAGCRLILTEDMQDGRELEGLMFVSPFKPENEKLLNAVLPRIGA